MEDGGWDRFLIVKNGGTKFCMGHTSGCWEPGPDITPGVWQHVVSIYDNGAMRFYLNGTEYTTATNEGNHSSAGKFTIGANQNGSGNRYKGLIDEVAVWDKALSAAEITALYNSGGGLDVSSNSGNYISANNLEGYWKMDGGSGTSLTDSSSNSNTATLSNMTNADWVEGNASLSGYSDFYNITNVSGHTKEDGTTATFNVALKSAPSANVTVNVSSSNNSEGTVSPSSLTFTTNNWNTAQTVTVTGVNDSSLDGHQAYKINLTGVHSPHRYWRTRNLIKKYAWNIKQIQFLSDTTLYDASQNTIAQPESSAIHNGSNCIQSGQYPGHGCDRSFDNNLDSSWANWAAGNEAQTWIGMDFGSSPLDVVHVRLMPGRPQAAGQTVAIEWSDDKSNWTAWSGGTITTRAKEQSQTAGSRTNTWDEVAIQDTFSLALHNLDDDTDTTVAVSSSDTGEATVTPATLTFTEDNWDTPQTVTVTGVDDSNTDGHQDYDISLSATVSVDSSAINFDGVNDYVAVNGLSGKLSTGDDFTISTWFKTDYTPSARHKHILFSAHDSGSGNTFRVGTGVYGGIFLNHGGVDKEYGSGFNDNNWHFVSVVITGTGVPTVRVDGNIISGFPNGQTSWSSATRYSIGQEWDSSSASDFWNGFIDEVAIWKAALSSEEVTALYNSGNGLNASSNSGSYNNSANLIAYWQFNEGSGTVSHPTQGDPTLNGTLNGILSSNWSSDDGLHIPGSEKTQVGLHNLDDDTDFTVGVSSSNITEGTVSPSTITFTENNWNTPQTVTVTGVDDNDADGHQDYDISLSATVTVEGYANDITDNLNSSAYTIFGGQSPSYQSVENAFDGNTSTKYYNQGGAGTGVIIDAGTASTVNTLGLTTAEDVPDRDPNKFSLYGSNNGSSWVSIVENTSLNPPNGRNTNYSDTSFSNSVAYQYYKLVFETTRNVGWN